MSDKELYQLCKKYGTQALEARRKFGGLLPEVNRRRLYERRGFCSIYMFAAKLAGMRKTYVQRVLQLDQKFADFPLLKNALVAGEVSVNKLARIASIVTRENERELFEKVQILSQPALEIFVREVRRASEACGGTFGIVHDDSGTRHMEGEAAASSSAGGSVAGAGATGGIAGTIDAVNNNGFFEPLFGGDSVRPHRIADVKIVTAGATNLNNDLELMQSFPSELKSKLHDLRKRGFDVGKLLLELLAKREEEIAREKERIAEEVLGAAGSTGVGAAGEVEAVRFAPGSCASEPAKVSPAGRYVPVKVRKIITKEFGSKCSMPYCYKPAKILHHTLRFALVKAHDPRYLAPLCEGHHGLAHCVDVRVAEFGRR